MTDCHELLKFCLQFMSLKADPPVCGAVNSCSISLHADATVVRGTVLLLKMSSQGEKAFWVEFVDLYHEHPPCGKSKAKNMLKKKKKLS